jgi:hypothetical protein
MAPKKRVRDLARTAKDFPVCLQIIEASGWVPHVLCDTTGAYWDGLTATDKEGKLVNGLSDSFRKQIINMIHDGCFGVEARDAYIDQGHYWRIRDELIEFPNEDAIRSKGLRALQITRRGST